MTTTASALSSTTADGVRLQLVVAIEGYDYLLTDGPASIAVTAWSGTGWSQALEGLFVDWRMQQDIRPWDTNMSIGSVVLEVMDADGADTFGVAVGGSRAGTATQLDAQISVSGTTITVKSTTGLTSPVNIGTERITFSGTTSTTLTGCTRGTCAPFGALAGGNVFGRGHNIPAADHVRQAQIRPEVSTKPRHWIGRWVGIWAHVNTGGALNTKADAQLLFAGTIKSTRDSANGSTLIECVDARQSILDCTLLRDQYVGKVQEGFYFDTSQIFTAADIDDLGGGTYLGTTLRVVSGASGAYEMEPGLYTVEQLASVLNTWFAQAKSDGNLNLSWNYIPASPTPQGARGRFDFTWPGGPVNAQSAQFFVNGGRVFEFMGFGSVSGITGVSQQQTWTIEGSEEPFRILPATATWNGSVVAVGDSDGSWVDNTQYLPHQAHPLAGSQWGILKFSTGDVALVQKSASSITIGDTGKVCDQFIVENAPWLRSLFNLPAEGVLQKGTRWSDQADVDAMQVVVLEGPLCDTDAQPGLLTVILTSTGTNFYNDISGAAYNTDIFASQLGAAIPQELLGTTWTKGLAALGNTNSTQGTLLVIDRPQKLWDRIKTELLLRRIHLVWKNGTIQPTTWSTPTSLTALFSFDETNKATPSGVMDSARMPAEETDEFVVSIVKISYNRMSDGSYRDTLTIVDPTAMGDSGGTGRVLTIEAPNSYGGFVATGNQVEALATQVAAWLPLFSRPLRRLRRSMNYEHICDLAPGDQATVSDDFARDPSTGQRGLTSKAALVLATHWDLGGPSSAPGAASRGFTAEVDLLILPSDRVAVYSPCAEVDWTAGGAGYNAGTKVLTCLAHGYSNSFDVADATRFVATDAVYVIEQDPSNPAAPLNWTDVVAAQSGNTITLTTGLGGFDATKRYRVFARHYSLVTATQRAKVFQADDADGMVVDTVRAYEYGYAAGHYPVSWTLEDPSTPPALYTELDYGDGIALTPGSERDLVRTVNNLVNYRTAPSCSFLSTSETVAPAGTGTSIVGVMPVFVGIGELPATMKRLLYVAPMARNTDGVNTHSLTLYLCRRPPTGTSMTKTSTTTPEYQILSPLSQDSWFYAAGAGATIGSESVLDARVADPTTGIAYLVVEVTHTGSLGIRFRGLAKKHLGPLVPA